MDSGISSDALQRYAFLAETGYFFPIPPVPPESDPHQWRKMGKGILNFVTAGNLHPAVQAYAGMVTAFAAGDAAAFNATVANYGGWLREHFAAREGPS